MNMPTGNVTGKTVRELVLKAYEPSEPVTTIARILRERSGKRVDHRLEAALKEALPDAGISVSHAFGMTRIVWGGWIESQGEQGGAITISASKTTGLVIDAESIIGNNPAHFAGRMERNANRKVIGEDSLFCDNLAAAIAGFRDAYEKLAKLLKRRELGPDRMAFEALAGLRDPAKHNSPSDMTVGLGSSS